MSAAETAQTKIHARAQHQPALVTAGMLLFHNQNVAQSNVHLASSYFLISSQYRFAACSVLLSPYS